MTVYKGLVSFELVVVVTAETDRRSYAGSSYSSLLRSTLKSFQVAPGRLVIAVSTVSLCQWRLKVNNRL